MLLLEHLRRLKATHTPPAQKQAEPQTYDPSRYWRDDQKLLQLTCSNDWLTLGDLFTGMAVFGTTGSGKTSALAPIAALLMDIDAGFVWLCAKSDEVKLVRRIARATGREDDVIVIGQDADGSLTPHRFNPLAYEASISTTGTGSVMRYLAECAKILSRKEGEKNAAQGEAFWQDQFERLMRYCIDTLKLAGEPLSIQRLRDIQLSAPTLEMDAEALENSYCFYLVQRAEVRAEQGEIATYDFERVFSFWTRDYRQLSPKTRSIIDVMFAVLVDAFCAEEPLRTILTTDTTVTPEDVIERGKIVVLSLPTSQYHENARMMQFAFKYSFQRAMLRRKKPDDGTPLRPTVLWVDEAHQFCAHQDAEYFREVRSNRGINIYLEQGIGGYMKALGMDHPHMIDDYLQNLATKIFFQNNSAATNNFAADAIGKFLLDQTSESFSYSIGTHNIGNSTTAQERHHIISGQFGLLRRGGAQNNGIVTGYMLRPGLFNHTQTGVCLCGFPQNAAFTH